MEEQHGEHKQLCTELDFGIWIWSLSQFTCNGDSRKTDCDIPLLNTRWRYLSFHQVDTDPFLVNVICYITGATGSGGILNNRKMLHPEGLIHSPLKLILCRYDSERDSLKLVWLMDLFGCSVVISVQCPLEWSLEWSHKGGQTTGIAEGLR